MIGLSPSRFNALIGNLGQAVVRRKAKACPCRDENSHAALQGCPVCHGKGIYWLTGVQSHIGVSGMQIQRHWAQFGSYEAGDVVVTVPSDADSYQLSEYDRVLFLNSSQGFTQTFRKGVDDSPIPFNVQAIDSITWLEPNSETGVEEVVEPAVPPTLKNDNEMDWEDADEPPSGQYTMTGRRFAEYFVAPGALVQIRAHHFGASLPHRIVLRRWEIFGR